MALPKGWTETTNEFRRRLRSPADFVRIRPKPFEGVKGVYIVGGPLKELARGHGSHEPGAFVPQAVRFKKSDWGLTDAVGWFEASKFAVMRDILENPARRRRNPEGVPSGSLRIAARVGLYVNAIQGQAALYMKALKKQHDQVQSGRKPSLKTMIQLESYQERIYRLAVFMGDEGAPIEDPPWGLTEPLENPSRRSNPPKRLEAFKAAAQDAIERLSKVEMELSAAFAQALEAGERGAIPQWLSDKVRGLQLEQRGLIDQVKVAVARRVAALGEFSVEKPRGPGAPPKESRRDNPSERAAAVRRFEEFHGTKPEHFTLRQIPDLSKLVALGDALEIHYRAHVPRGPRNTPYRHSFGRGATLLTDAGGKALVILGDINVGRAPRGRLGYIRG